MKTWRSCISVTLLSASFLLAGCVSIPKTIQSLSAQPQEDYLRVIQDPRLYKGQESRFGGKVVDVVNRDQKTRLEIAIQPLDSGAKPRLDAPSMGRIYANLPGFVDPINVKNQYVTVLGTLKGAVMGKVGEAAYQFLVIDVTGFQRWHLNRQIMTPPMPMDPWFWNGPSRHGYRAFNPWWGFYAPGPMPVETYLSE